ncbi:MAG: hypothetical protein FP832_02895, partial [Nitrospirae bacterium]|nr:hypothetical protein [Nitrospirota bacterium]
LAVTEAQDTAKIEVTTTSGMVKAKANWLPQIMKDTGLVKSTSEAIRLIKQGGVKVNDATVTDTETRLLQKGEYIIKVGKRKFFKLIIQ